MEDVSLFILSLSHCIHAFFNVLFEKAKWRTVDAHIYGAHWHRVFFRGIYASPENKQSERGSTAQQVSLFHHVPNWDDTYPVCLFSITHESFDIKLFFCCLKKSETRGDFAASY